MKRFVAILLCIVLCLPCKFASADENGKNLALPNYYAIPCPEQGKIETTTTSNHRDIMVWTPYGYDSQKTYDVVLLLHGDGGGYRNWITDEHDVPFGEKWLSVSNANLYDWMVFEKKMRPVIIVGMNNAMLTSRKDLQSDIIACLKTIVSMYSTYAEDNTDEAIRAASEHFTLGGLSRGGIVSMQFMMDKPGYVQNYILLSGFYQPEEVGESLYANHITFNKLFIGCGVLDTIYYDSAKLSDAICQNFAAEYWYAEYAYGHEWITWIAGICDALQVMFPEERSVCRSLDRHLTRHFQAEHAFRRRFQPQAENSFLSGLTPAIAK